MIALLTWDGMAGFLYWLPSEPETEKEDIVLDDGDDRIVKVAAIQTDPVFGEVVSNLRVMTELIHQASADGAQLMVFPEASLTGYCYQSFDEALADAQSVPGPATEELSEVAINSGSYVCFGLVEKSTDDRLYNSAVLLGPDGYVGKYRKIHLPFEAVDRFVTPGNLGFPVFQTDIGRIGIQICYDLRFPEGARILALNGADIILHPTNLPAPGAVQPDHIYRTRAAENRVWIVSADRIGRERGVAFIGRSAIVDPNGNQFREASGELEEVLIGDVQPILAREKDIIVIPDVYELRTFRDRRPDLYQDIAVEREKAVTAGC